MSNNKVHILLIGPVTNSKNNLIGGATILFGYLQEYLIINNESFTLLNTQKHPNGIARIFNPIHVLMGLFVYIWRSDVFFLNSSRGGTKFLAPILFGLARIFGKKFVFRPFGGNMNEYTQRYNKIQKLIFKNTVLKADILFLETKALMNFYAQSGANIKQLPTSRANPPKALITRKKSYKKRFIYLGFINEEKGIDLIIDAVKLLGNEYRIDLYGPIKDARYKEKLSKVNLYRRVLQKDEVLSTLHEYDVLLLPTHYEGEGYPGVIIEAYSLGIPVITTNWKSIPEIVSHKETGLLIEPKSVNNLVDAMKYFNSENYEAFSQKARTYFLENFYTETVDRRAIAQVKNLILTKKNATNDKH